MYYWILCVNNNSNYNSNNNNNNNKFIYIGQPY